MRYRYEGCFMFLILKFKTEGGPLGAQERGSTTGYQPRGLKLLLRKTLFAELYYLDVVRHEHILDLVESFADKKRERKLKIAAQ